MKRAVLTFCIFGLAAGCLAPARGQETPTKPTTGQDSAASQAAAPDAPPKATKALLHEAQSASKKLHKPTLVMFHASWCGWCKRLEAVMDRPEFKKMFEDNYVILSLDVQEH